MRKKRKVVIGVLVGCIAAGGAGAAAYAELKKTADDMQTGAKTAQSAEVQRGIIANTIVGTGNLELDEAQSVQVPSGVTIEEVVVESGDQVVKGETLATVNEASVLKAVEETQDEIEELDEKISGCQGDGGEESITAAVDGRVKLIYAAADSQVTDVMLENGSLMMLSLDGLMAVNLEKVTGVQESGSVTVRLSSGTETAGTVETVSADGCTITLTDDGTVSADTVTVLDSDGAELGTGKLYIHQPLEVTGTAGVVQDIDVAENESVTAGTVLLTLEGTASQTQYQELLAEREVRSAALKKLLLLTKDQKITAQESGTVQSVNVSASTSTAGAASSSAETGSGSSSSAGGTSQMSASLILENQVSAVTAAETKTSGSVKFMTLSFTDGEETAQESEDVQDMENRAAEEDFSGDGGTADDSGENGEESDILQDTVLILQVAGGGENSAAAVVVPAPAAGSSAVGEAIPADGTYTGMITWNPGTDIFAAETDYQALVLLSAADGYAFNAGSISGAETGTISGIHVSSDGKTLEFQIAFPRTAAAQNPDDNGNDNPNGQQNGNSSEDSDKNDAAAEGMTDGTEGGSGDSAENFSDAEGSSGNPAGDSGTGSASGPESGNGSAAGTAENAQTAQNTGTAQSAGTSQSGTESTASTDEETVSGEISDSKYSTDVTAFTISPDENMLLPVSVDELDINSMELGQEAEITFDAFDGELFEGKVTSIGNTASVNGGVAKYTVEISVPRDDRMKQGMNASATVTIENRENVLTIPMNALQEQGTRVFVYTAQEEDGTLSGEQEVTTGLSDGSTVEITEGLSEGDTVYYIRTGNTQSGSSDSGSMGGFGGDMSDFGSFGGGNMGGSFGGNRGGGNMGGGTPPDM